MKKFISIFIAVILCITAIVPLTLSAENKDTDPIKSHLFVTGVQEGKELSEVSGLYDSDWSDTCTSKFTGVKSMVSYTQEPSVKFDNANVINNYSYDNQCTFTMQKKTVDGVAFIFYVKMPAGASHEMFFIATTGGTNGLRESIKSGEKYSLLSVKGSAWEEKTVKSWAPDDDDGLIDLPDGFEGYVRIPVNTLYQHTDKKETEKITSTSQIEKLGFRFSNYGGSFGPAYLGPIMVQENETDSTMLSLGGADAVSLIEEAVKAHLLVSDIKVGETPSNLFNEGGTSTFIGVESIVNYDDHATIEIANKDKITALDGKQQMSLTLPNIKLNGKGFLFYVKTPDTGEHILYTIIGTQNNNCWPRINFGKPYQLLADTDTEWKDMNMSKYATWVQDGVIVLPSGFSGHVRIPFTSMTQSLNADTTPTETTEISKFSIRLANYGGDLGNVTVGPIMIDENLSGSTSISLDKAKPVEMQQEVQPSSETTGLKADIISKFDTLSIGDDLVKANYGSTVPNVTLTATNSQVGYTDYPSVAIDSKDTVSIDKSGVSATQTYFHIHIYQKLTDATHIMFYVKMPDKENKTFLVVETNTDGSTTPTSWPRVEKDCDYSLLSKGTASWESKKTIAATSSSGDNDGLIEFPAGFEGYVKIPLTSIKWTNSGISKIDDSYTITRLLFRTTNFGGTTGKIIMSPFFKVTQDADEKTAYINGAKEASDLFEPAEYDPNKPLLNFQAISDTHVDDYGGGSISIGARQMINALKDIKNNHSDSNAILHGGDITEIASEAQYAQAYSYFDQYSPTKNILAAIGNHDIRGNMSGSDAKLTYDDMVARYLKYNKKYVNSEKPYFDTWINGYHFIVLCTDEKLKDEEVLSEEQLEWFTEKVKEGASSNKPIFVLTHNPVQGTFRNDTVNTVQPSDRISEIISRFPQVILFTGHLHTIDTENMIISKGKGVFVDMPSLHNDNRPVDPTDEFHKMYYNVNVYNDRVDIELYDYDKKKNVQTFSINTSDFGKTSEEEPEAPKDPVMKADLYKFFEGTKVGDDPTKNSLVVPHYAANEKNKANVVISESLNGLTGENALKIDSENPIVRHGIGDQTQFDIRAGFENSMPVNKALKNGQAFVMYVKMPTGDDGSGTNELFFNIQNSNKSGADLRWNRFPNGTIVKYLAKGTNKWQTVTTNDTGTIKLPVGFEGFIYAPFKDIVDDAIFEGLDNLRYFQHFGVSVGYFGGDYGPFYFMPVLMAKNDTLSKDGVMYNGSDKVSNLFTGDPMTEKEVYEDPTLPPEIGTVYPELPAPTTEDKELHDIADEDVTGTTVKLSWDPFDGASKYRVDIYKSEFSGSGLLYRYNGNMYVDGTSCTVTGLEPSTQYYFVVNALDANGKIIATYSDKSTNTQYTAGETDNTDDTDSGESVNNNSAEEQNKNDSSVQADDSLEQTGDSSANVFPLCLVALVFTLLLGRVSISYSRKKQ